MEKYGAQTAYNFIAFFVSNVKRFFLLDFFSACKCHIFSIDFLYRFNLAYALAVRKLSNARDGIFFCGGELGKQNYSSEYNHYKISDLGIKFTYLNLRVLVVFTYERILIVD